MKKNQIRVVKKTIFSKNRITLFSTANISSPDKSYVYSGSILFTTLPSGESRYSKKKDKVYEKVERKCESPLGFYYYKTETITKEVVSSDNYNPHVELAEVLFVTKKNIYTLNFPIGQGNIIISVDTRPWNIVNESKSFPDHLIKDLYNDLECIFSELYVEKAVVMDKKYIPGSYRHSEMYETKQGLGEFKNKLYLNIFGNIKGPVGQTDVEKILSHGFDPKISFRKDKQK